MPTRGRYARKDSGYFIPYPSADKLVPPSLAQEWSIDDRALRNATKFLIDAKHRIQNSYTDPLSALYVVDMLERWDPRYDIRAKYLVGSLNQSQDKILFEPNNVGRILGELTEVATEAYATYQHITPIVGMRDYRGRYYLLNGVPTTWKWLWKVRLALQAETATMMDKEKNGAYSNGQSPILSSLGSMAPELL